MPRQTKNVITRAFIEKELRFYNTADIKSALVSFGVLTPIFLPITIGITYGILSFLKNVLIKIVLSVMVGGLTSVPIWINLLALFRALSERNLLIRGDVDIVTRDVSYKSEQLIHRHIEEYLHFHDFKEVSVEHTVFLLASAGDTFYIVHYKAKKDIKLLYSTKMYELQ